MHPGRSTKPTGARKKGSKISPARKRTLKESSSKIKAGVRRAQTKGRLSTQSMKRNLRVPPHNRELVGHKDTLAVESDEEEDLFSGVHDQRFDSVKASAALRAATTSTWTPMPEHFVQDTAVAGDLADFEKEYIGTLSSDVAALLDPSTKLLYRVPLVNRLVLDAPQDFAICVMAKSDRAQKHLAAVLPEKWSMPRVDRFVYVRVETPSQAAAHKRRAEETFSHQAN